MVVIDTTPTHSGVWLCQSLSLYFFPSFPSVIYPIVPLVRMKSLEQDALKAQMVIAKSRDGKKRGTLDQLTESPSPAPTPSPTPMEGRRPVSWLSLRLIHMSGCLLKHCFPFCFPPTELSPRGVTSPGRLVSLKPFSVILYDLYQ